MTGVINSVELSELVDFYAISIFILGLVSFSHFQADLLLLVSDISTDIGF